MDFEWLMGYKHLRGVFTPQTGTRKPTVHPAAETLKLLSGNPVMHDGRKPLDDVSSFPETFVLD
jgi:hypothetical protein